MKTKMMMSKSVRHQILAATLITFALPVTLSLTAPGSAAQSAHHIERTVDGKVVNKTDAPLGGSVVYLKDTHTLSIKTYICDDAGHFRFGQLSQNSDYELWAESNGVKSNTKSISSFDDRNSYYFTLTVK
jgi:hypothetical protein